MADVSTGKSSKKFDVKKKNDGIRVRINKYFESRRERTYSIASEGGGTPRAGRVDTRFLTYTVLLLCFGAVMSFSASYVYAEQKYGDSSYFIVRYIIFALLAVAVSVPFVMLADIKLWRRLGCVMYALSIVLLVLVIFVGRDGGGAQRWLDLGIITVQPSEIAKPAVVMLLAHYMSKNSARICDRRSSATSLKYGALIPMCIFGTVCVLVALEKHISGLMIIGMLSIAVMYMGGTRTRWIVLILAFIAVAGVGLILVSDYAQERVNTWLHIEEVDPLGSAWQTLQGLYAIGSGGLFGVGLGTSIQKHGYVSQPQNDFIFTIICEELGFVGALAVILLFALLVIRGFRIAAGAPDAYSALLVRGLSFKIALQVVLNVAVVTNSMPNTGISLPLFSSGGTSLALQIFELCIILSVSRYSSTGGI